MVHVGVTPLRRLLSDARPNWNEKDLAAVEEKLSRVGATTIHELAELMAHGLNKRLQAAGLKAFNSETLAALRSRLETEVKIAKSQRQVQSNHNPKPPEPANDSGLHPSGPTNSAHAQHTQEQTPKTAVHDDKERPKVAPRERSETPPPPPAFNRFSPSTPFGRAEALGETQLISAVRQSDVRTVQYLLSQRADPNEKDNFGETALMEAAGQGQAQICRILLENAANPACKAPSGLNATQLASEHQSMASLCCRLPCPGVLCMRVLRVCGVTGLRVKLRHLFALPADYWFDRGLRLAARQHDVQKAEILLQRAKAEEIDLNFQRKDANGFGVLHASTARAPDSDDGRRFVRLLISSCLVCKPNLESQVNQLKTCSQHLPTLRMEASAPALNATNRSLRVAVRVL